jgi:hypothetical protein
MISLRNPVRFALAVLFTMISTSGFAAPTASPIHVWQKQEIALAAAKAYPNPYMDMTVWVDLTGPNFKKRVYGFWDGDKTFRVRIVATEPGKWSWTSGSSPADGGLSGKTGSFTAVPWTAAEKEQNPLRRGFIRATANGHALQYADGTPYLIEGDTWWSLGTFHFPWFDDDNPRPMGSQAGFKDYIRLRKSQGFNLVGMLLSYPAWAHDGKPAFITVEKDGHPVQVRGAWTDRDMPLNGDMKSIRDTMHNAPAKEEYNEGGRPFLFPGKVPGYENVYPDVERINPEFFKYVDRKVDYLNEQGFVVFMEALRRDLTEVWKQFYPWPDDYARYLKYMYARYGANNTILSPVHLDINPSAMSSKEFLPAINKLYADYGPPPFGNLVTTNTDPSTLVMWKQPGMDSDWLTLHQIGNLPREHGSYFFLTDEFFAKPALPAFNGEPYYAGRKGMNGHGASGGSADDSRFMRSAMYGSFLSGGLGGFLYGSEAIWGADIEAGFPIKMWDAFQWDAANYMKHYRTFVMCEGNRYQQLIPNHELVTPSRTQNVINFDDWAYAAATEQRDFVLVYFEKGAYVNTRGDIADPSFPGIGSFPTIPGDGVTTVRGLIADTTYDAQWFDPRTGEWQNVGNGMLKTNLNGWVNIPPPPSSEDWGLRLLLRK